MDPECLAERTLMSWWAEGLKCWDFTEQKFQNWKHQAVNVLQFRIVNFWT